MKKLAMWFLLLGLALGLAGCGGGGPKEITVSPKEAKEIREEYSTLSGDMAEAVSEWTDENGYVAEPAGALDAMERFAEAEQAEGGILSYSREEENVILTMNSGIDVVYSPRIEGMASGGEPTRLVSWEPTATDFSWSTILWDPGIVTTFQGDSVDSYLKRLTEYGELGKFDYDPQRDSYKDQDVTVNAFKQLKPNTCVFFVGHCNYTDRYGSLLDTEIQVTEEEIQEHYDDLICHRVVILNGGTDKYGKMKDGLMTISPAFFEHYYGENGLKDCAFFLGGCSSCKDPELPCVLFRCGADVVIGTDMLVSVSYDCLMVRGLLDELAEPMLGNPYPGQTYYQALEAAKEKYGQEDVLMSLENGGKKAQFHYYGDEGYQIAEPEHDYDHLEIFGGTNIYSGLDQAASYVEETDREGDYGYAVVKGEAVLTHYYGNESAVTLPETLGGCPVTAVGQSAFRYHKGIRDVIIPDGYYSILAYAFSECPNLQTVEIGADVVTISRFAFTGGGIRHLLVYDGSYGAEYCNIMGVLENGVQYTDETMDAMRHAAPGHCFPFDFIRLPRNVRDAWGNVVQEGNRIYYWQYDESCFENTTTYLGGRFPASSGAAPKLICRLGNEGKYTNELPTVQAGGSMALTGSRIYYSCPSENNRIYSLTYDGKTETGLDAYGEIVYCDPDHDLILLEGDGVSILKPEEKLTDSLLQGEYLGCSENIAYIGQRGDNCLRIVADDLLENRQWTVCEIPTEGSACLTKVCMAGDRLYFGVGAVGGTGYIFQGGELYSVDPKGGTREYSGNLEAGGGFTVSEDGTVTASGPAAFATYMRKEDRHFVDDSGVIYETELHNGVPLPMFLPEDTEALDLGTVGAGTERALAVSWAERFENDCYALLLGSRVENGSMVRPDYTLYQVVMIHKNLDTGLLEILYDIHGQPRKVMMATEEGPQEEQTQPVPETTLPQESDERVRDAFWQDAHTAEETCVFRIPEICLETPEAEAINREIYDTLFPDAQQSIEVIQQTGAFAGAGDSGYAEARSSGMDYVWLETNGLLSLVTYNNSYPMSTPKTETMAYLVDSTTAQSLSEEEILSRFGLTVEDVVEAIGHDFLNGVQDSIMSSMENDVHYCFTETLDMARDASGRRYFLDQEGNLCCDYEFSWMAGAGRYGASCRVTGYKENPYYAQWAE